MIIGCENMEWVIDILKEKYEKIKNPNKKVEGLVPDFDEPTKHYQNIRPGDSLVMRVVDSNSKPIDDIPKLSFTAYYIKKYDSAIDMIQREGLSRINPEVNLLDDAIKIYHTTPGKAYMIKRNGIYAVGLAKRSCQCSINNNLNCEL